jgi:hypothetical protein
MDICEYPNCRKPAVKVPVIALPTFRTVGLHKPVLDLELVNNPGLMRLMQLDRGMTIRQYEAMVAEYNNTVNNVIRTEKPTYLIGNGLCQEHADSYNFLDWFGERDWKALQEAARTRGILVPSPKLLKIFWRPMNWTPAAEYLEVER